VASCEVADAIARVSVDKFRSLCSEAGLAYQQTCVAAVVALCTRADGSSSLEVLSVGAGTKFARAAQVFADTHGQCMRDCHAEVLARRGFQRFLRRELQSRMEEGDGGRDTGIGLLAPPSQPGEPWTLQPGVSLHLYSSSAPCGNASIRRWAKCDSVCPDTQCRGMQLPEARHPKLQVLKHAYVEGMVALSVKREPRAVRASDAPTDAGQPVMGAHGNAERGGDGLPADGEPGALAANSQTATPLEPGAQVRYVASGTAAVGSGDGCLLSCSDKICRWNALGLQGSLLAHFVRPMFLRSICVGRRYSKRHLERALCCRIAAFSPTDRRLGPAVPSGYGVAHPSMLCTSVKLDEGAIATGEDYGTHACFDETRCLCWARGDRAPAVLDAGGSSDTFSSRAMLYGFGELWAAAARAGRLPESLRRAGSPPADGGAMQDRVARAGGCRALKRRELEPREYAEARELLLTRTELREWELAKQRGRECSPV
jgi:double-stranded RNA-specific adenosine deaminase